MTDAKKSGRRSTYRPEFAEKARKLALLGLTDEQIAKHFSTSRSTISLWKTKHDDFREALSTAKEVADAEVVNALYQRACGYSHKAVKIFHHDGKVIKVEYVEHYPPDTAAAFIWLKNRQPHLWRDKVDLTDSDATQPPEAVTVTVEDASDPDAEAQ
jgi:transcriptional regulator with XRE-family HTH domain